MITYTKNEPHTSQVLLHVIIQGTETTKTPPSDASASALGSHNAGQGLSHSLTRSLFTSCRSQGHSHLSQEGEQAVVYSS